MDWVMNEVTPSYAQGQYTVQNTLRYNVDDSINLSGKGTVQMAFVQCSFSSETLHFNSMLWAILPEPRSDSGSAKKRYPTLWLLHGGGGDCTEWVRYTSIERYVRDLELAVIMPQAHLSFYTDMVHGPRYWTFLSEELPRIARSLFPLAEERELNYVAGLSMGGYGALKWALKRPDMFAAAAGLSTGNPPKIGDGRPVRLAFGQDQVEGTEHDLIRMIEELDKSDGPKPKFYQSCGTEDFLYDKNAAVRAAFEQSGLDYTYTEGPGVHNWDFWDGQIREVLKWLPLPNRT
jgi:S-formylglutathione hydrolase FrmB